MTTELFVMVPISVSRHDLQENQIAKLTLRNVTVTNKYTDNDANDNYNDSYKNTKTDTNFASC